MEKYNGNYKLVCADNKAEMLTAWYGGMSGKDLEAALSPDNVLTTSVFCTSNGVKASFENSKVTSMNNTFEHVFGEEKAYGAPFNCKTVITKCGDNCMKEVATYGDGAVYTFTTTFSTQGYTVKTTGANGYIGTAYFERCDPCLAGFYVMESHENLDKMVMEDAGVSASVAAELLSHVAIRITENNGNWTMTDYMADVAPRTINFRLGEESEYEDEVFKMKGTQLVCKTGPATYSNIYKDAKTGKSSVWEATLTDDLMVFKCTKPLNTQSGTVTYRRLADIFGTWKVVANANIEGHMKAMGLPDSMITTVVNERPVSTTEYLGKGKIKTTADTALFKGDLIWRSGEEFDWETAGFKINEIVTHTRAGFVGATKTGKFNTSFKATVGKTFMVIESTIDGMPNSKSTQISVRL
eukprot:TRINITY_DN8408_c0_g1_i5.p1 TRINITY_DN8408_c0_g1~~TRINITY_DN8408_c0_g1_i5.p1  ORF type:complete len:411 (+),score=159.90 TRINITY_DN8408_c0_g1_i5:59-1291(+)